MNDGSLMETVLQELQPPPLQPVASIAEHADQPVLSGKHSRNRRFDWISPLGKFIRSVLSCRWLILLTLGLTMLGDAEFCGWPSDLACHFRVQYALVLALSAGLSALFRHPRWALAALVGFAVNAVEVAPLFTPPATAQTSVVSIKTASSNAKSMPGGATLPSPARLKILHINVLLPNREFDKVAALIRAEKPDVLSLQEADTLWIQRLAPVLADYPYVVAYTRPARSKSLSLYSKIPLQNTRVVELGDVKRPNLIARIVLNGRPVTLVATHPYSPTYPRRYYNRQKQMAALAQLRQTFDDDMILVGDLNNSPFSPSYKRFIQTTALQDSAQGQGFQPTWPQGIPIGFRIIRLPAPLIPVDHVLVSPRFQVRSSHTGPFVGSDHLPLIVELSLR